MTERQVEHDSDYAIESKALTVAYAGNPVLWNVDVQIPRLALTGIIGPNGAGKSTLIKAILGIVPITAGACTIASAVGSRLSGDAIGYVPQRNTIDWDFPTNVFDVVMMGTYGKLRWFQRPGKRQREETQGALQFVDLLDLKDRQIGELSGGQQQRVFLARAFVQQPSVYLLDEPFAGVDAKSERSLLKLLRRLVAEGSTVVMVHHDLTKVTEYFDHVVLLNRRIVAQGRPTDVFTDDNIATCYGGGDKKVLDQYVPEPQ